MDSELNTCEKHKESGNTLLKENHFEKAIDAYT